MSIRMTCLRRFASSPRSPGRSPSNRHCSCSMSRRPGSTEVCNAGSLERSASGRRVAARCDRSLSLGPMSFVAETFAAHLARAVDLFRDPERREDQKREFRALVTMLQEEGATVRAAGGRIVVNGIPIDGPQLDPL